MYTTNVKYTESEGPVSEIANAWQQLLLKKLAGDTVELVDVYDCMAVNIGSFKIPPGALAAGYDTGSGGVPWTPAQFAAHPHAVHFDQSPVNTPADETSDVIDLEQLAATLADLKEWVPAAWKSWITVKRPGQRTPTAYSYRSNITPVVNALLSYGIKNGVNLFLSQPMPRAEAINIVNTASGPFPYVGVQYEFHDNYDVSVVSRAWLDNVSRNMVPPPPNTHYTVEIEHYKDGFGWVLDTEMPIPAAQRYRARIFSNTWSNWQEFTR